VSWLAPVAVKFSPQLILALGARFAPSIDGRRHTRLELASRVPALAAICSG